MLGATRPASMRSVSRSKSLPPLLVDEGREPLAYEGETSSARSCWFMPPVMLPPSSPPTNAAVRLRVAP